MLPGQMPLITRTVDRDCYWIVPFPPTFFAVRPGLSECRPENEKQHEVLDISHRVDVP
jgi:hypothetical protein